MNATLREFVTVGPGGVVRVQSDLLHEGSVAEVLINSINASANSLAEGSVATTWKAFIGAGANSGRSVEEIDASIRELRDEWR